MSLVLRHARHICIRQGGTSARSVLPGTPAPDRTRETAPGLQCPGGGRQPPRGYERDRGRRVVEPVETTSTAVMATNRRTTYRKGLCPGQRTRNGPTGTSKYHAQPAGVTPRTIATPARNDATPD